MAGPSTDNGAPAYSIILYHARDVSSSSHTDIAMRDFCISTGCRRRIFWTFSIHLEKLAISMLQESIITAVTTAKPAADVVHPTARTHWLFNLVLHKDTKTNCSTDISHRRLSVQDTHRSASWGPHRSLKCYYKNANESIETPLLAGHDLIVCHSPQIVVSIFKFARYIGCLEDLQKLLTVVSLDHAKPVIGILDEITNHWVAGTLVSLFQQIIYIYNTGTVSVYCIYANLVRHIVSVTSFSCRLIYITIYKVICDIVVSNNCCDASLIFCLFSQENRFETDTYDN